MCEITFIFTGSYNINNDKKKLLISDSYTAVKDDKHNGK